MKVLPTVAEFSREALSARFLLVEESRPYGNEALGYSLLVEKTWTLDPVKSASPDLDAEALKPLGLFRGPQMARANPYVVIQAIRLEKEITAADWLTHVSRTTGWDLEEVTPDGPDFCDALVEVSIEGKELWGRAFARIDGDRAFLVLAVGPSEVFEKMAPTYGVAVSSFRLLRPGPRRTIEDRASHVVGDEVRFSFPVSWQSRETRKPELRKSAVDLYNFVGEELHGLVRVKVARTSAGATLEGELDLAQEEMAESNVVVGGLRAQSSPALGRPRFREAVLRIHDAEIAGNPGPMELWTCGIDARPHVVTVTLLAPGRESEFVSWAIGRRAFEIALETLA